MIPIQQLQQMNNDTVVDDIKGSSYHNTVENGDRIVWNIISEVKEVLRENIQQMSMPLAGETGFWYVYELWDEYSYLLKIINDMNRCPKKDYHDLPLNMKSCLTTMVQDILGSFRRGNIWQEGAKDAQMSACPLFTLDKLNKIAACSEAHTLIAIDRNDRVGLDTRGPIGLGLLALNNVVITVNEKPVSFVSACAMNLLCIAMSVRHVPSSVAARNTVRVLEKFNVMFSQLFRSLESTLHMVKTLRSVRTQVRTECDELLFAACLSWLNGIKTSVEVVFAIDEEISQQVKGFPCLVEVAALTQKKITCCVYSALVEMLVNAVKLYSVDNTLTITKLYSEDCRRNKILKDYIKISNLCKEWLKCLENIALQSILVPLLNSENNERPTLYPYSLDTEKSWMWHLTHDLVWKNYIAFAVEFKILCFSRKRYRGKELTEEELEYLGDEITNRSMLKLTSSSQVICYLE